MSSIRRRISTITQPAGEADRHAADGADHEVQPASQIENVPPTASERRPVGDERRAVVDQALALDDRDDPPRDRHPAHDRGGGDRVGRGDDGAERERGRPRHVGHERLDHDGDGAHRDQHEPDRLQRDRAQVAPQVVQVGEEGRRVEQRRQEDHEHELGLELDVRQPGHEAEHQPADDQHDRVGDVHRARGRAEDGHRDQEADEDELDVVHQADS